MSFVQEFLNRGWKLLIHETTLLNMILPVLAVFCAVVPLDISHLVFALSGALVFAVIQSVQPKTKKSPKQISPRMCWKSDRTPSVVVDQTAKPPTTRKVRNAKPQAVVKKDYEEVRKPSSVPIVAPVFQSLHWEDQIHELLSQIAPTAEDDKIVARLASHVRTAIQKKVSEVEVVGFTSGDLKRNKAFGVAVPEVDIVANINPDVLENCLRAKSSGKPSNVKPPICDGHRLRKTAVRAFTDVLVSDAGFKFRRSAFRNEEPKVTLLAPQILSGCDHAIPIDFSVNAISPLHNAALMMECSKMEPRAKELILLVKRWAKDRGICHAAKGHLSPYSWTLLCIFFLQAREEPLLPPLDGFKKASVLCTTTSASKDRVEGSGTPDVAGQCSETTSAMLFKEFLSFYSAKFDWRSEAISIKAGKRSKPGLKLPLHIIVCDNGETEVGPSIEDPFDETVNLGSTMGRISLARLQEEVSRAHQMCSDGSSLAQLLEPWAPEREALQTDESS